MPVSIRLPVQLVIAEPALGPYRREPLPFPSVVVASCNDTFCDYQAAHDMATCWGSLLIDAGNQGHINATSGHGHLPEGLMAFSKFLSKFDA